MLFELLQWHHSVTVLSPWLVVCVYVFAKVSDNENTKKLFWEEEPQLKPQLEMYALFRQHHVMSCVAQLSPLQATTHVTLLLIILHV